MVKYGIIMTTEDLIKDKITGFFMRALQNGYNYNDAWELLLQSKQGQGILNNDYTYSVHFQGSASADKADKEIGNRFVKSHHIKPDVEKLLLLAELISLAHSRFGMRYENIFSNISLDDFMNECGNVLGNYDDKLIKTYLI